MPKCQDSGCPARPGDVYGAAMRNKATKNDTHSQITLNCKVCNRWCIVKRPDWITHIKDRRFYFETPWPLTAAQRREAMGHNAPWALQRPALPRAAIVEDEDAHEAVVQGPPIDFDLANAMEMLGRVPIWDKVNVNGGIGRSLLPPKLPVLDKDGDDVDGALVRVLSPVSPDRSRPSKRTKMYDPNVGM